MAMNNPAFRNEAFTTGQGQLAAAQNASAQDLHEMYNRPSAPVEEPMTMEDTIAKSAVAFGVLLVGAAVGWLTIDMIPFLWIGAGIVGFVLALVNIFKKQPSGGLVLAYSAAQGVFVGGISAFYEAMYPGIVAQAVIATLAVVGVTLALFASGKIRASKRATKVFLVAMIGYVLFSLINVGLMIFGVSDDPWGLRSGVEIFGIPLGIVLAPLIVIMAGYSLVLDFDFIQRGVRNRAPKAFAWSGAFGIMVTVIWLYLELLRIFAIARD